MVRAKTNGKIIDIEQRIRSLKIMKKALEQLATRCSGRGPVAKCPILEGLDEESQPQIR